MRKYFILFILCINFCCLSYAQEIDDTVDYEEIQWRVEEIGKPTNEAEFFSQPNALAASTARTIINIGTKNASFSYTNSIDLKTTTDGYRGTDSNDVFYQFTINKKMDIEVVQTASSAGVQNCGYLIKANNNSVVIQNTYPDNLRNPSPYSGKVYYTIKDLPAGTYYAIFEASMAHYAGTITIQIKGTSHNNGVELPESVAGPAEPVVVNMGTQANYFTYTNTHNTSQTTNGYEGTRARDIFYKFTITRTMNLEVAQTYSSAPANCGYLIQTNPYTLLRSNIYPYNTSNPSPYKGYVYYTYEGLPPGTYYAIFETSEDHYAGRMDVRIKGTASQRTIVDVGSKDRAFSFSHTQNTTLTQNAYMGRPTNDVFYKIQVTTPMDLIISHCGSAISNTYVSFLDEHFLELAFNDNDDQGLGGCYNRSQSYLKMENVQPGTYYVVSEGYSLDGNITTRIEGVLPAPKMYDIGTKSVAFTYTHTENTTSNPNSYVGQASKDVFYKLTLGAEMNLKISHNGSALGSTYAYLLNADKKLISSIGMGGGTSTTLDVQALSPGVYYIVSEGSLVNNGNIKTTITGTLSTREHIIEAGTYGGDFYYTHTQDTRNTTNAYQGDYANDVFYKLILNKTTTIVASHCGSEVAATNLHLLDENRKLLGSTNANLGLGGCANYSQAYLEKALLAPGTYYIVSEGVHINGNITTTIEGYDYKEIGQKPADTEENYVKISTPRIGISDVRNANIEECTQTIQYYDGFGRPTQTIMVGITPQAGNLVTLKEYDSFGRESKSWLPIEVTTSNAHPAEDLSYTSIQQYNTTKAYNGFQYENSPLNRKIKTIGPGNYWHTNDIGVKQEYLTNTASGDLSVTYYKDNNGVSPVADGKYEAGELFVEKITDGAGNVLCIFTDKLGQVILERRFEDGSAVDVYYVYDGNGNISYVIPPLGYSSYGYSYKYDTRNRCIESKLAGNDPVYYVYDKSDRLVFSQDGNQGKKDLWTMYKYDRMGRILYTAQVTNSSTHTQMIANCKDIVVVEEFSAQSHAKPMSNTGYSFNFFNSTSAKLLNVYYYDNYDFLELVSSTEKTNLIFRIVDGYSNRLANARGLLTGTRNYLLNGSTDYVSTAHYYDERGREVQTNSKLHLDGGYEKNIYRLSFNGMVEAYRKEHGATGKDKVVENYFYRYDHGDRLTKVVHQVDNHQRVIIAENGYNEVGQLVSKDIHNSMEQIKYGYYLRGGLLWVSSDNFEQQLEYGDDIDNITGSIWKVGTEDFPRKYAYTYDGLNRLKSASYREGTNSLTQTDGYTVNYSYDKMGNITSLTRRGTYQVATNPAGKPLTGIIDNLTMIYSGNKLTKVKEAATLDPVYYAAMHMPSHGNSKDGWIFTYDKNGNMVSDESREIQTIAYNYLNLPESTTFGGTTKRHIEYNYDASGIKRKVSYYSAAGTSSFTTPAVAQQDVNEQKSNQLIDNSFITMASVPSGVSLVKEIDYCNNIIYTDGKLDKIIIPEGYITRESDGKLKYHYYLKDHQGNNRVVLGQDGVIEQVNHYYPFGALFFGFRTDDNGQMYKYNGKELDRMFGLDMYDYEARGMNAVIGRFTTIDPLADKYYGTSPYVYAGNNPINNIDMHGDSIWFNFHYNEDKELTGVTMNVSGKVLDDSNNKVNMNKAVASIKKAIERGFKGKVDGVDFKTEVNLEVANSMEDVIESDHLFVLTNDILSNKYGEVTGVSNNMRGKVAFIDADYFTGLYDVTMGSRGTGALSAAHEFGHLAGLDHVIGNNKNLMTKGGVTFNNINSDQLREIYNSWKGGYLNQGRNWEKTYIKRPNRGSGGAFLKR